MFNSLSCVKRLEEAGVSREQAETHIEIMSELLETNLVTHAQFKEGISELRSEMKTEFQNVYSELKDLRSEMKQMEYRMTIKLGTMMSVSMGILFALIKLT